MTFILERAYSPLKIFRHGSNLVVELHIIITRTAIQMINWRKTRLEEERLMRIVSIIHITNEKA